MNDQSVIWTVGINCSAEDEDKFNVWYDDVHVPMLMQGDCVRKVSRFKLAEETYHVGVSTQPCPTYLTIYEFDSQEKFEDWMKSPSRIEAGEDKTKTWGDKVYDVQWATRYDLTNTWNG
jgi:antibiotic biosynthesis monooxygenase (ABM) superfamily enzyme